MGPPGNKPGSFPRDVLARDERVLYESQPNILPFIIGPLLGFLVFLILGIAYLVLVWVYPDPGSTYSTYSCIAILIVFLVISLLSIVISYLRWQHTHYALTDRRAITTAGILGKAIVDCPYDKIQNVTMVQGFLERLLGYGTIVFATAGVGGGGMAGTAWRGGYGWGQAGMALGMGNVMFVSVNEPIALRKFIEETMEQVQKTKKQQEFREMAAAFGAAQAAPLGPQAGGKFCTKCGAPNPPSAAFCASCGNRF